MTADKRETMKGKENRRSEEDFLRSIVEATASVTGADFFRSLVRNLAFTLQVRYAFVPSVRTRPKRGSKLSSSGKEKVLERILSTK